MQNMWTDNSSTAYSSAEAVKQERIFMIYCCYISKGYKVNNVITFSCPCLWAATNCIWQWPSLPPSLDWETLSWQSPHFQRLKTLFQILNLPLALERRSWPGAKGESNILSSCPDLRYPRCSLLTTQGFMKNTAETLCECKELPWNKSCKLPPPTIPVKWCKLTPIGPRWPGWGRTILWTC